MIITKLQGGLGNQMFQYAYGLSLSKVLNTNIYVDLSFLDSSKGVPDLVYRYYNLDVFSEEINILDSMVQRRTYFNVLEDNNHNNIEYPNDFFKKIHEKYDIYLDGYFQKHIYVDNIKSELINKIFVPKEPLDNKCLNLIKDIRSKNSVCVNFRREFGRSVENFNTEENRSANSFHNVYGMEYFNEAIKKIETLNEPLYLYVFSDDIEFVTNNFKSNHPFVIIDHSYSGDRFIAYLEIMKACKHFIIPNSSFAWWAAYLSNTNGMVITPQKWYNYESINTSDLRPNSWHTI